MQPKNPQDKGFSFEFFPPKTDKGAARLDTERQALAALGPAFFSVTFGAGGSTRSGTITTVVETMARTGIPAAPHLSCIEATSQGLRAMLDDYRAKGVRRIVVLRGDLPEGMSSPGEFGHANELVAFIREHYGDAFRLEVACYPETHPEASDPDTDLDNFARKVEAGADSAITQYFYNIDAYADFVERVRGRGVDIPIIPGIMPIVGYQQLIRFSDACGADVPRWIRKRLERYQDDAASLRAFGIDVVTGLCERLLAIGAPGLHFYTLNRAEPTASIWRNLGLAGRRRGAGAAAHLRGAVASSR